MNPDGTVNNDKFLRAMLQYRNTPQPDTRLSPAQVVYGRYMKDFIPVVNDKYEPKQEWAMVREYRERALARRLDRDGARLEQYTKKQKVIPVGGAVAVQNQTGRFPKKWDKTGVVVDNLDHDKVLVRMDGSRRLTTRNRRFVRKILSPPDMPDQTLPDIPLHPEQGAIPGPVVRTVIDDVPTDVVDADTPGDTGGLVEVQQGGGQCQSETGGEMVDDGVHGIDGVQHDERGWDVQQVLPEPSSREIPSVGRPKRDRRPNVRYKSEEYDLSAVSATRNGLLLSGVHVKQGRPKDRKRC